VSAAAKPRALLVEDEAIVRVLARDALIRAGFEVDEAADGLVGIARIEDPEVRYDVIFMDMGLPGARGEEILARAAALRPGVPVVVCTGEPMSSPPAPAVMLLAKPFTPRQISSLAKRLVGRG
jgi:CheY-like chemotaxis protein